MKRRLTAIVIPFALIAAGIAYWMAHQPRTLMLTGIVTTDDVQL